MGKFDLSRSARRLQSLVKRHGPELLVGIGIAGMITTTIMAVKATPKACRLIENEKYGRALEEDKDGVERDFTPVDYVKTAWKCYVPSAIVGSLSVACLIGASSVNARRNAALATAYTISETALKEYKGKVVETIGKKKEEAIKDSIVKDKVDKDPVKNKEVIIVEKGNTLCYDALSGRYFKSDIEKLKKAMIDLNINMVNYMYVSLNDFYDLIGLSNNRLGDVLGWNLDDGQIELDFSSVLTDDTPCIFVDYNRAPKYGFDYN